MVTSLPSLTRLAPRSDSKRNRACPSANKQWVFWAIYSKCVHPSHGVFRTSLLEWASWKVETNLPIWVHICGLNVAFFICQLFRLRPCVHRPDGRCLHNSPGIPRAQWFPLFLLLLIRMIDSGQRNYAILAGISLTMAGDLHWQILILQIWRIWEVCSYRLLIEVTFVAWILHEIPVFAFREQPWLVWDSI